MNGKPQPSLAFLERSNLSVMLRRIDLNAQLLERVKKALPETLAGHCLYCVGREDGNLIVFTDSPAFATPLRFLAPAMLAEVNQGGEFNVRQILVRNLPPSEPLARPIKPMKTPAGEAIEAVKSSAASAPCPELGEALARLGAAMERYTAKDKEPPVFNSDGFHEED